MITKLNWMVNRISLMSTPEIGYRMAQELRKRIVEYKVEDIKVPISSLPVNAQWYLNLIKRDENASFVTNSIGFSCENCDEMLDHKFSFFAFKNEYIGGDIDWHKDYKSGKQSPITYSKTIDYRDHEKIGDIKYIWELNRHQHLVTLAKDYYLTGKQDYKTEVVKQISSWMDANPYMRGVNWESNLEVGIRLIAWSWVWRFLGDLDDAFQSAWLESIYRHCYFIENHFAKFSSANNHLIGEAAGLFIAAVTWPCWEDAQRWQQNAKRILIEEMENQNYDDGVNKEQAIAYQQFVLDFFLLAGLLGKRNNIAFPENYWERIESMLHYIASVMDKDGNVPNIGDADDGYALRLTEDENFNPYRSLLASGAVIFNRGDFKTKAKKFDEKSFWLLGQEGTEAFKGLPDAPFKTRKSFKEGGYYILSDRENASDEVKAIFDCGPLGYLSIAAHGHADALSLTLNVGGLQFLIDPGTFAYHTHREWRDYFKGTAAHNTIRVDGQDQSLSGGNFMWLKKAKARILEARFSDEFDYVCGEHDGYHRFGDPVTHKREVHFDKKKGCITITDHLKARQNHHIEQIFHFAKDCQITRQNDHKYLIHNGERKICMECDSVLSSNIYHGSTDPIWGWESRRFDVKDKSYTLVNSAEMSSGQLVTLIKIS